jgi:hypothetical protein
MYFVDVFILFHCYIVLYYCTLFFILFSCVPFVYALYVSIILYIYFYSDVEIQRAAIGSQIEIDTLKGAMYQLLLYRYSRTVTYRATHKQSLCDKE